MKKWIWGILLGLIIVATVGWWSYENYDNKTPQKRQDISNPESPSQPSHIDMLLSKMSLRDKVSSLLMMNTDGTDPAVLGRFMDKYKLGGFILMGKNMPANDAVLQAETAALRGSDRSAPRLVATDEEGGTVKRLLGDAYPDAQTLRSQQISATTKAFSDRSAMVQSVGITLNFGIVADTTVNPESFIYDRVLGTTPQAAGDRVAAAVHGSKNKTLTTLKHFPGHGETTENSHTVIPTIPISYDQWRTRDKPPFAAGIQAGADVVMMGHLRYEVIDDQPASLSKKWHDILRNELGFKGVIITDAMGMLTASGDKVYADPVRDAILALQAGNNMLLYVINPAANPDVLIDGIVSGVKRGELDEALINRDVRQVLELRSKSAALVR